MFELDGVLDVVGADPEVEGGVEEEEEEVTLGCWHAEAIKVNVATPATTPNNRKDNLFAIRRDRHDYYSLGC